MNLMPGYLKNSKEILDNFLIFNFFIIISGAVLFAFGILSNLYGFSIPYNIFQKLWFPLFIPSLSIFFTAILFEAILKLIQKEGDNVN